ncbi:uncharacterized protein LOC111381399 [Olea europaea var. sylvestris]|uniref:uncharacterized protein LOC111381399 n=1 Tax=Olea europaea var. sylvestris TaxID=158386 RepID=UPI000C1CD1C3|nr:uncharacterized protein LOC111381399 [Olea europaea var. sylvestris]
MSHKFETLEKFKEFRMEVKEQLGKSIKALRSNRENKYIEKHKSISKILLEEVLEHGSNNPVPNFCKESDIHDLEPLTKPMVANELSDQVMLTVCHGQTQPKVVDNEAHVVPLHAHHNKHNEEDANERQDNIFNGPLNEIIYMMQPEGFVKEGYERKDQNIGQSYDSRKSTSGSVFTLEGGIVVWRSIKQSCIANSTMKAEYVATCEAAKETVWFKSSFFVLDVISFVIEFIILYYDNSAVNSNIKTQGLIGVVPLLALIKSPHASDKT